jgi:hypothetical protein
MGQELGEERERWVVRGGMCSVGLLRGSGCVCDGAGRGVIGWLLQGGRVRCLVRDRFLLWCLGS